MRQEPPATPQARRTVPPGNPSAARTQRAARAAHDAYSRAALRRSHTEDRAMPTRHRSAAGTFHLIALFVMSIVLLPVVARAQPACATVY